MSGREEEKSGGVAYCGVAVGVEAVHSNVSGGDGEIDASKGDEDAGEVSVARPAHCCCYLSVHHHTCNC